MLEAVALLGCAEELVEGNGRAGFGKMLQAGPLLETFGVYSLLFASCFVLYISMFIALRDSLASRQSSIYLLNRQILHCYLGWEFIDELPRREIDRTNNNKIVH